MRLFTIFGEIRINVIRTIVPFLAFCFLISGGCDKAKDAIAEKAAEKLTEKMIEKETGKKVDIESSDKSISIKTTDKKGNEVRLETGAQLPQDWPKKIPVYPGAEIEHSLAVSKRNYTISMLTSDSQSKVIEFYRSKLSELKQEAQMDMGEQKMLRLKGTLEGEEMVVTIVANRDADKNKTMIMIAIEIKASE
ncbi:MAG: hypothetical protein JXA30_11655 [Deltaproteobacteria bacterium]|nr:hypothetical protein [Deltaproteobacteria bacterium]